MNDKNYSKIAAFIKVAMTKFYLKGKISIINLSKCYYIQYQKINKAIVLTSWGGFENLMKIRDTVPPKILNIHT